MISVIIIIIFGILVFYAFAYAGEDETSVLECIGISVLFTAFLLIILILISLCTNYATKEKKLIYSCKIASLERRFDKSGGFILGTGSVDENPVYYFYKEPKLNNYILENVTAYNTTLIESINKKPSFTIYSYVKANKDSWWVFNIGREMKSYEIVIPKESIIKSFTIGLIK